MIQSVTVTNYVGDSLEMVLNNPQSSGFNITSIEGIGPVESSINSTELSTMDGSIYTGARSSSRNIAINLAFYGDNIEELRHKSYRYFPIKKQLELVFKTDERTCRIAGYVEKNEPAIFSELETTQISVVCMNPWFQSYNPQRTEFSAVHPLFEFPFSNESLDEKLLEMGEIVHNERKSFIYLGDVETGFTLTIHVTGTQIGNISVYNVDTRENMDIDVNKLAKIVGGPLTVGDDIIISTINGNRYAHFIRQGVTYNILNAINRDADWFQLSRGVNRFAYTAESGDVNLQLSIENPILYEGI